jgi:chromosome segregation ATPase
MSNLKQIYDDAAGHSHLAAIEAVAAAVRIEVAAEYELLKNEAINAAAGVDVALLQTEHGELTTALGIAQAEVEDLTAKLTESESQVEQLKQDGIKELTDVQGKLVAATAQHEALLAEKDITAAQLTDANLKLAAFEQYDQGKPPAVEPTAAPVIASNGATTL